MNQKERCTCNMFGRNAMQNSKAKCMDAIFQKFKTWHYNFQATFYSSSMPWCVVAVYVQRNAVHHLRLISC